MTACLAPYEPRCRSHPALQHGAWLGDALRQVAKEECATTARKINHRATQIGTEADYDETWGGEQGCEG